VVSFLPVFRPKYCMHFSSLPFMLHALTISRFDHANKIRRSVQVTKPYIMQSLPAYCRFLPRRSWYSPQYTFLDHPQIMFFHTFAPCYRKIYSNIILSCTPVSSELSLPFRSFDHNLVRISHLFHACCMPCSSNTHWLDHPIRRRYISKTGKLHYSST